jgi:hypothetical protein
VRKADTLELTSLGGRHTQTVRVKRGTLEVSVGHLSYVAHDDEQAARTYVTLHALERWRYIDRSRSAE